MFSLPRLGCQYLPFLSELGMSVVAVAIFSCSCSYRTQQSSHVRTTAKKCRVCKFVLNPPIPVVNIVHPRCTDPYLSLGPHPTKDVAVSTFNQARHKTPSLSGRARKYRNTPPLLRCARSLTTAGFARSTRTRSSADGYTQRAASEAETAWLSCCTGILERRRRWGGRGRTWATEV